MAKADIVRMKLSDLKTPYYVRTHLDHDHVNKLADLYNGGTKFAPIRANREGIVIDGRHRKAMYEQVHHEDWVVDVELVDENDPVQLLAMGLRANEGGAKQASRADVIHTVRMMMQNGATEKLIYASLPYTKPTIRGYINIARQHLKRGNLTAAKQDVQNGMTVQSAALKWSVPVEDLKRELNPKIGLNSSGLENLLKDVSHRYFALSKGNVTLVKRMVLGYSEGEVTQESVEAVFEKFSKLINRQEAQLKEWRKRFDAAKQGRLIEWNEISKDAQA